MYHWEVSYSLLTKMGFLNGQGWDCGTSWGLKNWVLLNAACSTTIAKMFGHQKNNEINAFVSILNKECHSTYVKPFQRKKMWNFKKKNGNSYISWFFSAYISKQRSISRTVLTMFLRSHTITLRPACNNIKLWQHCT